VIKAEQGDVDRIESLAAEAAEHLEDDDLYGACLMRAPQRDGYGQYVRRRACW